MRRNGLQGLQEPLLVVGILYLGEEHAELRSYHLLQCSFRLMLQHCFQKAAQEINFKLNVVSFNADYNLFTLVEIYCCHKLDEGLDEDDLIQL